MRKYSLTPPCNVSVFCVLFFHLLALISPWTYSVKIIRHNSERHREIVHSKNNALCSRCLTVYQSEAYVVDHVERDHQQQQPEVKDDDDDGVDGEEHEEKKGDEERVMTKVMRTRLMRTVMMIRMRMMRTRRRMTVTRMVARSDENQGRRKKTSRL